MTKNGLRIPSERAQKGLKRPSEAFQQRIQLRQGLQAVGHEKGFGRGPELRLTRHRLTTDAANEIFLLQQGQGFLGQGRIPETFDLGPGDRLTRGNQQQYF